MHFFLVLIVCFLLIVLFKCRSCGDVNVTVARTGLQIVWYGAHCMYLRAGRVWVFYRATPDIGHSTSVAVVSLEGPTQ